MGATLPCFGPHDSQQSGEELFRLNRPPAAHASEKTIASGAGTSSPWSMQSAATRRASDLTDAIAEARVAPYAITPGMDSISAHQRPSSSRPTRIGIDSTVMVPIALRLDYTAGSLTRCVSSAVLL